MSKIDFQKEVREEEGYILSEGTLNMQHLLPRAYDLIRRYNVQDKKNICEQIRNVFQFHKSFDAKEDELTLYQYQGQAELRSDSESRETADYIWNEDIFQFFSDLAPQGYYFGSVDGDGACIGWFKNME